MRQPLLKHTHIIKLGRFLDMLYRPSEIAEEIGVTTDTVCRSYIPAGLPYTRDENNRIWIHGPAFAAWAKATIARKKSQRVPLPDGQGWCMRCNQAVEMIRPTILPATRYFELLQSPCPHCGGTVNRGRARQHPSTVQGEGQGMGVKP